MCGHELRPLQTERFFSSHLTPSGDALMFYLNSIFAAWLAAMCQRSCSFDRGVTVALKDAEFEYV